MLNFAYENLRKKPKDAVFFAFSIMMTTAVIMIFYCIMNNPNYGKVTNDLIAVDDYWYFMVALDGGVGSGIFTVMLSIIMIGICITTIFFANNFYLLSKTKDIGIMMISGCTIPRIVKFLSVQNFIIILCTAPIGAILGFLVSPIVNVLIYSQMGINAPVWIFNVASFASTLATVILVCVWLVIVDAGFVYRNDSLHTLLKARTKMKARKTKGILNLCVYIAIYALALYFTIAFPVENVNFVLMYYVGALIYFGAVNVFRYVLPEVIAWIQRRYFSADKHRLLSMANLQYSLASANQLVTIILLAAILLLYYLCKFYDDPATFMVVLFTYAVILVLDIICIVYKMAVDAISKEAVFTRMICIGYLQSDIKKIIHQEVIGFFAMILLVALPQMGLVLYMYYAAAIIPISFILMILSAFLVALGIGCFITMKLYESIILHIQIQDHMVSE